MNQEGSVSAHTGGSGCELTGLVGVVNLLHQMQLVAQQISNVNTVQLLSSRGEFFQKVTQQVKELNTVGPPPGG